MYIYIYVHIYTYTCWQLPSCFRGFDIPFSIVPGPPSFITLVLLRLALAYMMSSLLPALDSWILHILILENVLCAETMFMFRIWRSTVVMTTQP